MALHSAQEADLVAKIRKIHQDVIKTMPDHRIAEELAELAARADPEDTVDQVVLSEYEAAAVRRGLVTNPKRKSKRKGNPPMPNPMEDWIGLRGIIWRGPILSKSGALKGDDLKSSGDYYWEIQYDEEGNTWELYKTSNVATRSSGTKDSYTEEEDERLHIYGPWYHTRKGKFASFREAELKVSKKDARHWISSDVGEARRKSKSKANPDLTAAQQKKLRDRVWKWSQKNFDKIPPSSKMTKRKATMLLNDLEKSAPGVKSGGNMGWLVAAQLFEDENLRGLVLPAIDRSGPEKATKKRRRKNPSDLNKREMAAIYFLRRGNSRSSLVKKFSKPIHDSLVEKGYIQRMEEGTASQLEHTQKGYDVKSAMTKGLYQEVAEETDWEEVKLDPNWTEFEAGGRADDARGRPGHMRPWANPKGRATKKAVRDVLAKSSVPWEWVSEKPGRILASKGKRTVELRKWFKGTWDKGWVVSVIENGEVQDEYRQADDIMAAIKEGEKAFKKRASKRKASKRKASKRKNNPEGVIVSIKDLPSELKAVLGDHKGRDIELIAAETFSPKEARAYSDGYQGYVTVVNLVTGESETRYGDWGGVGLGTMAKRARGELSLDEDDSIQEIPINGAIVLGQRGGTYPSAKIKVHPDTITAMLPEPVDVTPYEEVALGLIYRMRGKHRAQEFKDISRQYPELGSCDADNPVIQSLSDMGLVKINKRGVISITTAGKNASGDDMGSYSVKRLFADHGIEPTGSSYNPKKKVGRWVGGASRTQDEFQDDILTAKPKLGGKVIKIDENLSYHIKKFDKGAWKVDVKEGGKWYAVAGPGGSHGWAKTKAAAEKLARADAKKTKKTKSKRKASKRKKNPEGLKLPELDKLNVYYESAQRGADGSIRFFGDWGDVRVHPYQDGTWWWRSFGSFGLEDENHEGQTFERAVREATAEPNPKKKGKRLVAGGKVPKGLSKTLAKRRAKAKKNPIRHTPPKTAQTLRRGYKPTWTDVWGDGSEFGKVFHGQNWTVRITQDEKGHEVTFGPSGDDDEREWLYFSGTGDGDTQEILAEVETRIKEHVKNPCIGLHFHGDDANALLEAAEKANKRQGNPKRNPLILNTALRSRLPSMSDREVIGYYEQYTTMLDTSADPVRSFGTEGLPSVKGVIKDTKAEMKRRGLEANPTKKKASKKGDLSLSARKVMGDLNWRHRGVKRLSSQKDIWIDMVGQTSGVKSPKKAMDELVGKKLAKYEHDGGAIRLTEAGRKKAGGMIEVTAEESARSQAWLREQLANPRKKNPEYGMALGGNIHLPTEATPEEVAEILNQDERIAREIKKAGYVVTHGLGRKVYADMLLNDEVPGWKMWKHSFTYQPVHGWPEDRWHYRLYRDEIPNPRKKRASKRKMKAFLRKNPGCEEIYWTTGSERVAGGSHRQHDSFWTDEEPAVQAAEILRDNMQGEGLENLAVYKAEVSGFASELLPDWNQPVWAWDSLRGLTVGMPTKKFPNPTKKKATRRRNARVNLKDGTEVNGWLVTQWAWGPPSHGNGPNANMTDPTGYWWLLITQGRAYLRPEADRRNMRSDFGSTWMESDLESTDLMGQVEEAVEWAKGKAIEPNPRKKKAAKKAPKKASRIIHQDTGQGKMVGFVDYDEGKYYPIGDIEEIDPGEPISNPRKKKASKRKATRRRNPYRGRESLDALQTRYWEQVGVLDRVRRAVQHKATVTVMRGTGEMVEGEILKLRDAEPGMVVTVRVLEKRTGDRYPVAIDKHVALKHFIGMNPWLFDRLDDPNPSEDLLRAMMESESIESNPRKKKASKRKATKKKATKKRAPRKPKTLKGRAKRAEKKVEGAAKRAGKRIKKDTKAAGKDVKKFAKTKTGYGALGAGAGALLLGPIGAIAGAVGGSKLHDNPGLKNALTTVKWHENSLFRAPRGAFEHWRLEYWDGNSAKLVSPDYGYGIQVLFEGPGDRTTSWHLQSDAKPEGAHLDIAGGNLTATSMPEALDKAVGIVNRRWRALVANPGKGVRRLRKNPSKEQHHSRGDRKWNMFEEDWGSYTISNSPEDLLGAYTAIVEAELHYAHANVENEDGRGYAPAGAEAAGIRSKIVERLGG